MGSEGCTLHILFFPFMAQGHMLPMLDIAKLVAARGVRATVLSTPANVPIVRPYIDHHPIQLRTIPFPSVTGLPEGCENLSSLPSPELTAVFFNAVGLLRQPFGEVLRELQPDAVVSDMFLHWTCDVAAELGIPRLVFHGVNFFSLCIFDSFDRYKPLENLENDAESVVIPGLPHKIEMLRSQIPDFVEPDSPLAGFFKQVREADSRSYGVVVNSFYELEPDYAQHYRKVVSRKAWHVGPVALKSERGNKNCSSNDQYCLKWLDRRRPNSVVYVCFGSLSEFSAAQLRQIALGLEASGHSFLFVVRKGGSDWIPAGFEERVSERGLIVRGWAPQIVILNHPAVGAFVTHCGWNSSLEGISAGLALVTWPLFAEQFYNEKLIVEVLQIGVSIGVKKCSIKAEEREVIEADMIEKAVNRVMDSGQEGEERRRRAKEVGEKARRAMEKGGSSYADMGRLIQELIMSRRNQGFAEPAEKKGEADHDVCSTVATGAAAA